MEAKRKRSVNVNYLSNNSSSDESETSNGFTSGDDNSYCSNSQQRPNNISNTNVSSSSKRRKYCVSRNAIMARENRVKKKMYIQNLENDVNKFKSLNKVIKNKLESQRYTISNLKKEVKYLKSVISNSKELGTLLSSIRNTVIPSSNNHKVTDNNHKEVTSIDSQNKFHFDNGYNPLYQPELMEDINPVFNDPFLSPNYFAYSPESEINLSDIKLNDHNYSQSFSNIIPEDILEDVGVCLHVSNHRVSLEFCSKCNEKKFET